jgi:hypothetical protein
MNATLNIQSLKNTQRMESLRALITERYGPARSSPFRTLLRTGIPKWDSVTGGIRQSATTEICGSSGNCALLLDAILQSANSHGVLSAIIDGGNSFEPGDYNAKSQRGILWVSAQNPKSAIQATDLLLRDGNLPLIALDLHGFGSSHLSKIPASTWHRFARLLEQNHSALLVFNSQPLVEGCQTRVTSQSKWSVKELDIQRRQLIESLPIQIFRRNSHTLRLV